MQKIRHVTFVWYNNAHMKKHAWKIFFAIAAVALLGSMWYAHTAAQKADEGVTLSDHITGNPDATVTLVEYSDFQCPACAAMVPFVDEVLAKYGDKLRFEYKSFPLITIHSHAVDAAVAAEAAAQQGKFWEMYHKLFENQANWEASANPSSYFIQYASDLGLDVTQFKLQLGAPTLANAVRSGFKDGLNKGFTSTPTFVLNGKKMEFNTYDDFIAQIETALGVNEAVLLNNSNDVSIEGNEG